MRSASEDGAEAEAEAAAKDAAEDGAVDVVEARRFRRRSTSRNRFKKRPWKTRTGTGVVQRCKLNSKRVSRSELDKLN